MNILLLLIPISLLLLGVAIWAFAWAVRRGQFDDLETPVSAFLKVGHGRTHAFLLADQGRHQVIGGHLRVGLGPGHLDGGLHGGRSCGGCGRQACGGVNPAAACGFEAKLGAARRSVGGSGAECRRL